MHESTTIIKEFQKVWRILKYIEHQFYRRHIQGRGIHAPYLFDFVYQGLFNASKTLVPETIRDMHRTLGRDHTKIPWRSNSARSVSFFVRRSSIPQKYGALLYRISLWFLPKMIIELGTGLGISALYLAAGSPDKQMHTIEGNKARASFAIKVIKLCRLKKVKVHHGDIDQQLEMLLPDLKDRFVAFLDGNHRYDPTIKYVRQLIHCAGEEAVIIMDDIYWSKEMYRAWKEVISWPEVRVSIDLYRLGILLLRKDLNKAHVKIKF